MPPLEIPVMIPGEMPDAIPNGTRARKTNSDSRDAHRDGELCTIMSSIGESAVGGYFVEWDSHPGLPVFTLAHKIERVR